ncbi:response regulator [Candidatus Nitrospira allomarina]|uniref:Response regulator n=1 Tax=Candidatus Nitrospira allomarina TaxID=3020900 RepID=A0AA96GCE0_9BACT|nr:response regulator [Candidatus Nitrospira allomarina]WNM58447.1 response regulator [Candidatus Nitrospira allomarina]
MSKPYVFVVDDDEVIRSNIAKKLSRLECTVRAFDSGEALMEFLRDNRDEPDVILVDYKMGGMNGVETVRAVRKVSSTPTVIFTAYEGLVDLQAVKQLGRCEVLLKTIDLSVLGSIVNEAMAVRKMRQLNWVDTGGLPT